MIKSSCTSDILLPQLASGEFRVPKCLETSGSRCMTNFKGIHAKISRASDQIDSLKADMDRFCENIRRSIVPEVHKEADEQVWVYRGETPNGPIEWSVRLGEILYNLRSALDHLVWQLVLANEQTPGRRNAFPIVNDECDWKRATRQLEGVAPEDQQIIRYLQPFTGGINLPFDVGIFGNSILCATSTSTGT